MKEFWMIRHAESQANAGEKTKNQLTTFLSEKGEGQAINLAKALSNQKKPDLLVISSYPRTRATLDPYLEKNDIPLETWGVHEFSYLSQIRYADTTFEERKVPKDKYWEANDPYYRDGDGAESYSDLLHRVEKTLRMILERKENRIWIFTHGQFMKAVICLLMSENLTGQEPSMRKFKNFMDNHELPNCSLVRVKIDNGSYWLSFKDIWSL
jgi:broad specificity phosphatase PhoE